MVVRRIAFAWRCLFGASLSRGDVCSAHRFRAARRTPSGGRRVSAVSPPLDESRPGYRLRSASRRVSAVSPPRGESRPLATCTALIRFTGNMKSQHPAACELCGRAAPLTFHHLIPKKTHGKRRIRKRYETRELHRRGIYLCRLCHRQLHRFYSEDELADSLNTRAAIIAEPKMARFLAWARKQK